MNPVGSLNLPTFFEFATAMAFYEFKKEGVKWAIMETGMGGRLDATNIINPEISVISNIALEHQSYLGDTSGQVSTQSFFYPCPQGAVF